MALTKLDLIEIPLPVDGVVAYQSTCLKGAGGGSYGCGNLAFHVGDDINRVLQNRRALKEQIGCKALIFMEQTHSAEVEVVTDVNAGEVKADGIITTVPGLALAVLTADCLPLLLIATAEELRAVAVVHCGWRGLLKGIVFEAVSKLKALGCSEISAWLGPCIGKNSYEVDLPVREQFKDDKAAPDAFFDLGNYRYLFDLKKLCANYLMQEGVTRILSFEADTLSDKRFYSYRREKVTGRMASVIFLA